MSAPRATDLLTATVGDRRQGRRSDHKFLEQIERGRRDCCGAVGDVLFSNRLFILEEASGEPLGADGDAERRRERRYAGRGHNAVMSSGEREVVGVMPALYLITGSMTATASDKGPLI